MPDGPSGRGWLAQPKLWPPARLRPKRQDYGAAAFDSRRSAKAGGAEETRTPDLLLAKQTLYQLSYSPAAALGSLPGSRLNPEFGLSRFGKEQNSLKTELCDKGAGFGICRSSDRMANVRTTW